MPKRRDLAVVFCYRDPGIHILHCKGFIESKVREAVVSDIDLSCYHTLLLLLSYYLCKLDGEREKNGDV